MDFTEPAELAPIREAVRALCDRFGDAYWRSLEPDGYPSEFVAALTQDGWLAALIPERYGGSGPAASPRACAILEEICASGANAGACHAQMYTMGTLLRHGSEEQKAAYLPRIASGELRLQAFAVTEPDAGSDTTQIKTRAERTADGWRVNGQKIWTSRAEHSDLMVLLARTTPLADVPKRTAGLSVFLRRHARPRIFPPDKSDQDDDQPLHDGGLLRGSRAAGRRPDRRAGRGLSLHPRRHERRADPDRLRVHRRLPLLPRPRRRLRQRAHRVRPADRRQPGRAVPARSRAHVDERRRPRAPQGRLAVRRRRSPPAPRPTSPSTSPPKPRGRPPTPRSTASAASASPQEYDIERKFRETRLYRIAPVNNNLVQAFVGQHVLGLPRSY